MAANEEGEYLRELARRVVDAAVELTPIRAALLAGSAGRGSADRFSDIDLLFYVDEVPPLELLDEVRAAVGGVDPLCRYEPTEYTIGEEFNLNGVRTEVSFTRVERIEWQLGQLLDRLDEVVSPRQKFLSGIAEGLPLYGQELIEDWQARVRHYPEALRRTMIERHWDFFPLWYYGEAMAARDAELWARHAAHRRLQPAGSTGRSQQHLLHALRAEADARAGGKDAAQARLARGQDRGPVPPLA